jgi:hypothetical protein
MSRKLMVPHHVSQSPKYTNRVYQKAYFNSDKSLSHEERDALATAAYEASK